uniref:Uncharacterized protein n=1 Tax=viral metagenome TaxID=1070528 RepID=A0A6C0D1F5_9ZZZZ
MNLIKYLITALLGGSMMGLSSGQESHVYETSLSSMSGEYYEVYTNMYVEITEQIDWQCVQVNITLPIISNISNISNINLDLPIKISKEGHLHAPLGYSVKKEFSLISCDHDKNTGFWDCISDDMSGVSTLTRVPWKYTIRSILISPESKEQAHTVIVTKDDDYSLYVWTNNVTFFKENVESRVLSLFQQWDYNTSYKTPTSYGGILDDDCVSI